MRDFLRAAVIVLGLLLVMAEADERGQIEQQLELSQ
jgi:hypothetical protein